MLAIHYSGLFGSFVCGVHWETAWRCIVQNSRYAQNTDHVDIGYWGTAAPKTQVLPPNMYIGRIRTRDSHCIKRFPHIMWSELTPILVQKLLRFSHFPLISLRQNTGLPKCFYVPDSTQDLTAVAHNARYKPPIWTSRPLLYRREGKGRIRKGKEEKKGKLEG